MLKNFPGSFQAVVMVSPLFFKFSMVDDIRSFCQF